MNHRLPAVFLALWLVSCQGAGWKRVGGERVNGPNGCSFTAPAGWMMAQTPTGPYLALDGVRLQAITVTFSEEARATKRKYDPTLTPAELAELFVAEHKSTIPVGQLTVIENEPATVAGKPGFRLRLRHNMHQAQLPVDDYEIYGVGHGGGLYVLSYGAWETYLFPRDLPAFEGLVQSFQLP